MRISALMISAAGWLMMTTANANASTMAAIICTVVNGILLGDLGRGVATLGVATIAGGAALGRVSFPAALTVAIGISVTFGAAGIVQWFGLTPC